MHLQTASAQNEKHTSELTLVEMRESVDRWFSQECGIHKSDGAGFEVSIWAGLFVTMLRSWEHSQVYHPSREFETTGAALGCPLEDVFFKSSDGIELNGWFFPADKNSSRSTVVVLVCHGNGGNIANRLDLYGALLSIGASVFAFDYRGYGRSQGRPSEAGTYLDAQAAYQWLRTKGFSGKQIIVYGESLGGGVASELCVREETCGLILQSTFTSIPDVGAEIYPWLPIRWISRIKYDTRSKLPRIKVPVLVVHGHDDDVIGFHHAERNFEAANKPKLFWTIEGAHNDPLNNPKRFIEGIEKFLEMVERAAKTGQRESKQAG